MTILWKHPHDHRPLEKRQGQPYYGHALRLVIAPPAKVSIVDRITTAYESLSPRTLIVLACCIVAAIGCAVVIVW